MKDVRVAASAIRGLDLGPSTDPDRPMQLFDLIPAAWIGAVGESREEVTQHISNAMAHAALSVPDIEQ